MRAEWLYLIVLFLDNKKPAEAGWLRNRFYFSISSETRLEMTCLISDLADPFGLEIWTCDLKRSQPRSLISCPIHSSTNDGVGLSFEKSIFTFSYSLNFSMMKLRAKIPFGRVDVSKLPLIFKLKIVSIIFTFIFIYWPAIINGL